MIPILIFFKKKNVWVIIALFAILKCKCEKNYTFSNILLKVKSNFFCQYLSFSVYAERMKNTQREFFTINNAWGLQRESVSKKSNVGLYACLGWTVYQKTFWVIYKTKTALCAYGEYAKRRNKYCKCVYNRCPYVGDIFTFKTALQST